METLIPSNLDQMTCAVVTPENSCVSLHQHPDAAQRLIDSSARDDLRVVFLPTLPGRVINFEESAPF